MDKIGVCFFEDKKLMTSGWASVEGTPAVRIGSVHDLSSDVLWVTNAEYKSWKDNKVFSVRNIKVANYFRTNFLHLSAEVGITRPQDIVEYSSKVFSNLVRLAENEHGHVVRSNGHNFSKVISPLVKPDFVSRKIRGPLSKEIESAILNSNQYNQGMLGRAPKGSVATSFCFPRESYFEYLFSLQYPGEESWETLNTKAFSGTLGFEDGHKIKGTDAIIDHLCNFGKDHAALLHVNVLSTESDNAAFQKFRVGARDDNNQSWASLPEIIHMAKYSKIRISGGFSTKLAHLSIPVPMPTPKNLSLSRGLLLENIFCAISTPEYSEDKVTGVGAYMRAYDRIICARVAESLVFESDFIVGSFGTGKVVLFLRDSQMKKAAESAHKLGLLPPFTEYEE